MPEANTLDDDHFVLLLTQSQRNLMAFIVGMTPTLSDADDVLQEVNLGLWKKRHLYDSEQEFLRWAFAFARIEIRRFRDRLTNNRLWASDDLLESLAEEYPHQQDVQVAEERHEALSECIKKLGSTGRRFITGFYREQLSAKDLAVASDRPVSTVYKTLTRARRALRECVERSLASQLRPQ